MPYIDSGSNLAIGDMFTLDLPSGSTTVILAAKIGAGSRPNLEDIEKWYGPTAPSSAYKKLKVDRYIFQKRNGYFVVVPQPTLRLVLRA